MRALPTADPLPGGGSGEPVIFLHQVPTSSANSPSPCLLEPHCRAIAMDVVGFGIRTSRRALTLWRLRRQRQGLHGRSRAREGQPGRHIPGRPLLRRPQPLPDPHQETGRVRLPAVHRRGTKNTPSGEIPEFLRKSEPLLSRLTGRISRMPGARPRRLHPGGWPRSAGEARYEPGADP